MHSCNIFIIMYYEIFFYNIWCVIFSYYFTDNTVIA